MYGTSIANANGLEQIRSLMGVCPQFDTGLWGFLTGREHIYLFASIKGIPASARAGEAVRLLEDVKVSSGKGSFPYREATLNQFIFLQLTEAANTTSEAYSGGMKRRLSVALALLGNPKVSFIASFAIDIRKLTSHLLPL